MRRADWQVRLREYQAAKRRVPHDWAGHDCARYCAGAVEAVTGRNPMRRLRYTTEEGAKAILEKHGGLAATVTHYLKTKPVRGSLARRGDVVELRQGCLAICEGTTVSAPAADGLAYFPRTEAVRCWHV